jgi:hypothetical protein
VPRSLPPAVAQCSLVRSMRVASILLVLSLSVITAGAQSDRAPEDKAAICATIADYIEGYYLCDAARMERSLHPHYLKHTISGSRGELKVVEKRGPEMVKEVRSKKELTPVSPEKRDHYSRYRW